MSKRRMRVFYVYVSGYNIVCESFSEAPNQNAARENPDSGKTGGGCVYSISEIAKWKKIALSDSGEGSLFLLTV